MCDSGFSTCGVEYGDSVAREIVTWLDYFILVNTDDNDELSTIMHGLP
jgi:hypothetical protein